jgi:hypothetical protein
MDYHIHEDFQTLSKELKREALNNFRAYQSNNFAPMIPIVFYGGRLTHYVMKGSDIIYMGCIRAVRGYYDGLNKI